MPDYYAYTIGKDGHITARLPIVSDDDEGARQVAKTLVNGHAIELWQLGRFVERFDPISSNAYGK